MTNLYTARARLLRKSSQHAERRLWSILRNKQLCAYKFRRQYIVEPYIVDFICLSEHLIIELDGSQHADKQAYDKRRTMFLKSNGFRVIRFWNNAIWSDIEGVAQTILAALEGKWVG